MPKVNLGTRYHSCMNHIDVKTPDKRLARGAPVLCRKLRSSENCLASGRAFKTQMIALERILIAKDCFHCFNDPLYLIF